MSLGQYNVIVVTVSLIPAGSAFHRLDGGKVKQLFLYNVVQILGIYHVHISCLVSLYETCLLNVQLIMHNCPLSIDWNFILGMVSHF